MSFNLKRIHFYLLKSFCRLFLLTFFISLFFLQLQFLYRHLEELVGKGVEFGVINEMMLYVSVGLLPLNFPLATLLASVITFGTLGENYELVAMKSAGISLYRIFKPLLALAALLSIAAFFIANNVIPETNVRYMTILNGLQEQRPELILQDGVFTNEIDGYSIKVAKIDKETNELFDVIIYDHNQPDNGGGVTVAPLGTITSTSDKKYVIISLFNGFCYQEGNGIWGNVIPNRNLFQKTSFDKQILRIRVLNFDFEKVDEAVFTNHHRMLTIKQLNVIIDSLENEYNSLLKEHVDKFELYHKGKDTDIITSDYSLNSLSNAFSFETCSESGKASILATARDDVRNNIQVILQDKQEFHDSQKSIRRYQIEKHRKITLSLSIFIFFLIGSSFGAVIRKGGISIPVVFSFLLLIVYFVIGLFGERLILSGALNVFEGAWLPYCLLLPLALWLTYLSANESTILVSDV